MDRLRGILDPVDQERNELADGDAEVLGVVDAEARPGADAARDEAGEPGRAAPGGGGVVNRSARVD